MQLTNYIEKVLPHSQQKNCYSDLSIPCNRKKTCFISIFDIFIYNTFISIMIRLERPNANANLKLFLFDNVTNFLQKPLNAINNTSVYK